MGKECVGERIRTIIYPMKCYPASLTGMEGEVSPEHLKRVFFGDPFHKEKGHGFLLGY